MSDDRLEQIRNVVNHARRWPLRPEGEPMAVLSCEEVEWLLDEIDRLRGSIREHCRRSRQNNHRCRPSDFAALIGDDQ